VSVFQEIEAEASAAAFEQETYELFESRFEGWSPAEGDVLVWLAKAWSRIGATVVDQARTMSRAAFKRFGESVVTVPPVHASPAVATSVWTMIDTAGYTIPAGTQVVIEAAGDQVVGFITVGEVVVAPGADKATVLLQAVEPGEAGNGLTADPILSDSLAFVSKIELEGATADGVDEEDEDVYLGRLVETLQTRSLSLIKGRDLEVDARGVPAIARAKCIEAWNADEGKEEALAVSVYPIDEDGESSSTPTKEELETRQTDKLLNGINYYVGTPSYTTIKGKVEIEVEPGFDKAAVVAAVEAWWPEKFSPARWGLPTQGDPGASGWENHTKVYRLKSIGEIERIGGVARVVTFKHAKNEEALGTAEELTLTGVAPLTKAGAFEVSAI
jgi:hypothetical protein